MRVYVAKRLVIAVVTLLGMSVVIFVLMRLAPGNITDIIFESAGYVDEADRKRLEAELGIDRPVPVQYVRWLGDLLQGDLGKSYRYDLPAWEVIRPRIPVTVELAVLAMGFAILFGVPTGVVSAIRRGRPIDYVLRVLSLAGLSMPSFWLGMVVILLLVRSLGWIPSMTYVSPFEDLRANLFQFLLPALAVGYRSSALIMRITRSAMLEVLREDYIRTAWAKGQREAFVVWRHALKNASLPVVTLIGIEFAFLIGGLIVTETVFNLPGVARYLVDAIQFRDYPIVQNLAMLIAVVVVVANLTVDLVYTWLDPRITYGKA
ncbi:MAG TPA: ABC transporter permease [Candidatus Tectomicrobia bacterium]|nr:ABC transporter permease [Candidatus Tectomicrobia bacterium]